MKIKYFFIFMYKQTVVGIEMKARPFFQILLGWSLCMAAPAFSGEAKKILECKTAQEAHIQGEVRKELAKASFDAAKIKKEKRASSTCCSTPILISTPGFVISSPGHYCVVNDIAASGQVVIFINSSNVELSIDTHTIFSDTAPTIVIQGFGNPISNIRIDGQGVINGGLFAISIINAQDITIENSLIQGGIEGLLVNFCEGLTLKNCFISNSGTAIAALATRDINICSCGFFDNDVDIYGPVGIDDVRIDDCFFDGAGASIFIVGGNGFSLNNSCFNNSDETALVLSNVNDVSIQNTLINSFNNTLTFSQNSNVFIGDSVFSNSGGNAILITGGTKNVEVESCQFFGSNCTGILAQDVSNLVFRDCTVSILTQMPQTGMSFLRGFGLQVSDMDVSVLLQDPTMSGTNVLTFQDCVGFSVGQANLETNAISSDNMGGNAVLIYGNSQRGSIQDCVIKSVQPNVMAAGISVFEPSEDITIQNTTIDGVRNVGIYLEGVLYSQLLNNTVRGTQVGSGIFLKGSTGISLFGNTAISNSIDGIFLDSNTIQCAVRDNTVSKNGGVGINNQAMLQTNKIYHNFAQNNRIKNYAGVELVAKPGEGVGALENIYTP